MLAGAAFSPGLSPRSPMPQLCPGACRQGERGQEPASPAPGPPQPGLAAAGCLRRGVGLQQPHSKTLLLFLSLSPAPFLSSTSLCPLLLPLSPAAMNPLLKSCHTHQDLPTSPPCPARRPALLIPCSRNCPVPADAGSKALVPCSNRTRCPFCLSLWPGRGWSRLPPFPGQRQ